MLPPVGCDNSCLLRDLWWLSQETRSLQNAIWKRHCSCSTTITKTNKPRIHLGKNVPLWCSTAEQQRMQWKNSPSCTVTHALQTLQQKFSIKSSRFNARKKCAKIAQRQLTSFFFLLIIFFKNVFIMVLMLVISYSGCIPLLIMGMFVFYFTKNAFLSSSPYSLLSTQISGDVWGYWFVVSDWKVLLCLLNLTFDFCINIDILYKFGRHDPRANI